MSKFKVGDRVRFVKAAIACEAQYVGRRFRIITADLSDTNLPYQMSASMRTRTSP